MNIIEEALSRLGGIIGVMADDWAKQALGPDATEQARITFGAQVVDAALERMRKGNYPTNKFLIGIITRLENEEDTAS